MRYIIYLPIFFLIIIILTVSLNAKPVIDIEKEFHSLMYKSQKQPTQYLGGKTLSQQDIINLIRSSGVKGAIKFYDMRYQTLSRNIIDNAINSTPHKNYRSESYDCDDFARVLMGRVLEKANSLDGGPAVGLIFSLDRKTESIYHVEVVVILNTGEIVVSNAQNRYFMTLSKHLEHQRIVKIEL